MKIIRFMYAWQSSRFKIRAEIFANSKHKKINKLRKKSLNKNVVAIKNYYKQ